MRGMEISHDVSASSLEASAALPRGDLERARSAMETGWAFDVGGDVAGLAPPSAASAFSRLARALGRMLAFELSKYKDESIPESVGTLLSFLIFLLFLLLLRRRRANTAGSSRIIILCDAERLP